MLLLPPKARGRDVPGALGCVLAGMDTAMLKPSTLCTERCER